MVTMVSWPQLPLVHHLEDTYGYILVEVDGLDVTLTWKKRTAPGVFEAGDDLLSYSYDTSPPRAMASGMCVTARVTLIVTRIVTVQMRQPSREILEEACL